MNWTHNGPFREVHLTLLLFCHAVITWRKTDVANVGANISSAVWKYAASGSLRQLVRIALSRFPGADPPHSRAEPEHFSIPCPSFKSGTTRENTGAWYPLIHNTSQILMCNLRCLLCDREKNSVGYALLEKKKQTHPINILVLFIFTYKE